MDDERPYWQRHYGMPRGPADRRSVRRFGLALVSALVVVLILVLLGWLISELG